MNEAADDKGVKEQSSSRMQIPLADLRSWCAVWASRKQQHELRLNLQRLIEQIDNADDGFPERPDEFDYEEPDDGTEGYFYLTVCFSHPGEFRFFVNRKGGALRRVSFVWGENGNIFSTDLEGPELTLLTEVWGWLQWNGEDFYPAWAA